MEKMANLKKIEMIENFETLKEFEMIELRGGTSSSTGVVCSVTNNCVPKKVEK